MIYTKKSSPICVILQTEYHANSIRLRRVLLLRSYIRLVPSDIRFASFRANRISLQGFALQYHFLSGKYYSSRQRRISLLILTEKERTFGSYETDLFSLSACNMGLGLAHLRLTSQMRCSHLAVLIKFSAKNITRLERIFVAYCCGSLCFIFFSSMEMRTHSLACSIISAGVFAI